MAAESLSLSEFHSRPGLVVDLSQASPVKLTKFDRPYAVVVSADWFDRAEKALADQHGNRRILDAHALAEDDLAFLKAHGPTPDEIESGEWRN